MQWDDNMNEKPIAFASAKLSGAQLAWAAIEKEAYAIVWSLNIFRTWIFGAPITIFADANPLTYLTASAPKSAKLTRWALALQEFNITFKYTKGHVYVLLVPYTLLIAVCFCHVLLCRTPYRFIITAGVRDLVVLSWSPVTSSRHPRTRRRQHERRRQRIDQNVAMCGRTHCSVFPAAG